MVKKHTKILNKKLYIFVSMLFALYAIITLLAVYYMYDSYVTYGLYYSGVVMAVYTSDFFMNLSIVVLMFVTTVVLFVSARQNVITLSYDPKTQESSSYGIEFPNGRPQHWDISANMETQTLEITLDDASVSVSKETIDGLFRGVIQKK